MTTLPCTRIIRTNNTNKLRTIHLFWDAVRFRSTSSMGVTRVTRKHVRNSFHDVCVGLDSVFQQSRHGFRTPGSVWTATRTGEWAAARGKLRHRETLLRRYMFLYGFTHGSRLATPPKASRDIVTLAKRPRHLVAGSLLPPPTVRVDVVINNDAT